MGHLRSLEKGGFCLLGTDKCSSIPNVPPPSMDTRYENMIERRRFSVSFLFRHSLYIFISKNGVWFLFLNAYDGRKFSAMKFQVPLRPCEERWLSPILQDQHSPPSYQAAPHSPRWRLPASTKLTEYPRRQINEYINKNHQLDCRQSRKKCASGIQNGKKVNSEFPS